MSGVMQAAAYGRIRGEHPSTTSFTEDFHQIAQSIRDFADGFFKKESSESPTLTGRADSSFADITLLKIARFGFGFAGGVGIFTGIGAMMFGHVGAIGGAVIGVIPGICLGALTASMKD